MRTVDDTQFTYYMSNLGYRIDADLYEPWDETARHVIDLENGHAIVTLILEFYKNKYSYLRDMYRTGRRANIKSMMSLLEPYDMSKMFAHGLWDVDINCDVTAKERAYIVFEITKFLHQTIRSGIITPPEHNLIVASHPVSPRRLIALTGLTREKDLTAWSNRLKFGNRMVDNRIYLYYDESNNPKPINEDVNAN